MKDPHEFLSQFTDSSKQIGEIAFAFLECISTDDLSGPSNAISAVIRRGLHDSEQGLNFFDSIDSIVRAILQDENEREAQTAGGKASTTIGHSWEILGKLLQFANGPENVTTQHTHINNILGALRSANSMVGFQSDSLTLEPIPADESRLKNALEELKKWKWDVWKEGWSVEVWQLLELISDKLSGVSSESGKPRFPTERVAVVLAADNAPPCTLRLCAERRPGPLGMVSPDWLRLGLCTLGKDFSLVRAVNRELGRVFEYFTEFAQPRYQIRWWLESVPSNNHEWVEQIGTADSLEVAIACLGLAVLDVEYDRWRPIVDDSIIVSARMPLVEADSQREVPIEELVIGLVDSHAKKIAAVDNKCWSRIIFAQTGFPANFVDSSKVKLLSRFGDVFENLLVTTKKVRQYKEMVKKEWTEKSSRGRPVWVEVKTHKAFIEASDEKPNSQLAVADRGANEEDSDDKSREQGAHTAHKSRDVRSVLAEYTPMSLDDIADDDTRSQFLVGQPVFEAVPRKSSDLDASSIKKDELIESLWDLIATDDDPGLDSDATKDGDPRSRSLHRWQEIARTDMIVKAVSETVESQFVAVVCGAGIGKSTNLEWLEVAINRINDCWGKVIAVRMNLDELRRKAENADHNEMVARMIAGKPEHAKLTQSELFFAERKIQSGHLTFLLDSLDQADPRPKSADVNALISLFDECKNCRFWISGRPYAFALAKDALKHYDWQALRIGELREPEARQLLETAGRRKINLR